MQFITGDEVGLVKVTTFAIEQTDESENQKPQTPPESQIQTKSLGKMKRSEGIQHLAYCSVSKLMAVAKSCGRVDIVSLESHSTVSSFQLFSLPIDHETGKPVLNKHKKSMHFIGLGFFEGRILTGTDNGLVWEFSINVPFVAAAPIEPMHLDQDLLCALKVNPLSPNLFATGGDEKEVCVWDVNALKMSDGICAEPIWKAKNVKHDFLDLRVPVWVTAIDWVPGSLSKLVIGTAHHHFRMYDTDFGKRPILSIEIGENPVRAIACLPSGSQAVFSDTIGNLTLVNLKDGNVARNFKSIAGAVTSIQALSSRPWIVCGGLDRFLRIFDVGKGSLVKGLYLKQRLSQVLVLEEEETNENDDGDADQDVWSSLAKVGEEQERRSSKKLKQM